MFMRKQSFGGAVVECLESRQLLATYGFEHLLGYDKLGASWTYGETYAVSGDMSNSGSGTSTIAVNKTHSTYQSHSCHVVRAGGDALTTRQAWYTDSSGAHLTSFTNSSEFGSLKLSMHSTLIAPKAMTVGRLYEDAGTFDGTFKFSGMGESISGSIKGTSAVSSKLYGTEAVNTPAGRFSNAIRGRYRISISGSISLEYAGETYRAKYSCSVPQNFWAVPGKGIVKAQIASGRVNVSGEGETVGITIDATSRLQSSSLLPGVPPSPSPLAVATDDVLTAVRPDVLGM